MKEVLQDIYIGRQSLDSIEFKYDSVEVPLYKGEDREFQIFIKNFAAATYIHFLPDDAIKDYLILVPSKHHIKNNEYVKIVIRIPYNARPAAEGMFYVVSGYGAQKKGFKISVGSDKIRASTLSTVGDLMNDHIEPIPTLSMPDRAEFIPPDEDDVKPKKPAFSVRSNWSSAQSSQKPQSAKSKKFSSGDPSALSQITALEKISAFIAILLISVLVALFVFIQVTDIDSIFNFDQTLLLALIAVGCVIFIVLLLFMFFKRNMNE
jgi:hypothetical protein